jgi:hypothetical protein
MRMLFVYAEPPRGPSVGWPFIKDTVEKQFKNQQQLRQNFTLDVVEGATADRFMQAFAGAKYDILHIVCHGEVAVNGTGSLVFQDTKGGGQDPISAAKLGVFLKDKERLQYFRRRLFEGIRYRRQNAGGKRNTRCHCQPVRDSE